MSSARSTFVLRSIVRSSNEVSLPKARFPSSLLEPPY